MWQYFSKQKVQLCLAISCALVVFLSCIKHLNVNRVLKIVTGLSSSADKSLE